MRARPAQVWPAIAPVIPTPAHPSYPSGHSTQNHLIAACMKLAVPDLASACDILANRIAFNRELAGVHFPSDTAAGKRIATSAKPILAEVEEFKNIVRQVRTEWGEPRIIAPPKIPTGASPPPKLPPTSL
jgi:acid phosphatase (class A)